VSPATTTARSGTRAGRRRAISGRALVVRCSPIAVAGIAVCRRRITWRAGLDTLLHDGWADPQRLRVAVGITINRCCWSRLVSGAESAGRARPCSTPVGKVSPACATGSKATPAAALWRRRGCCMNWRAEATPIMCTAGSRLASTKRAPRGRRRAIISREELPVCGLRIIPCRRTVAECQARPPRSDRRKPLH
jgi:hypothetical protein